MLTRTISAVFATLALASPAVPCAFHGYTPQATVIEKLLGSDHIVLARPTEATPFRFSAVEALEGSTENVDIPVLVDSTTRRRLKANPEDRVLFARDGAYGPWQRLGYVDAEMDEVLRVVMANLPSWEMGSDEERFAYFASLAGHADKNIKTLALRELDLAPYSILRTLPLDIDAGQLLLRLNVRSETDLKPIRILLLGLSQVEGGRAFFEAGVDSNATYSGPLLGAYATAMMEYGGPDAAIHLINRFLANSSLPPLSREMLAEALAIHSSVGDDSTGRAIRTALDQAIRDDPVLAPLVARQFGARFDWSQAAAISDVMERGVIRSPLDMLLLTQYVALAKENDDAVGN